jgi:hypothetical protein
VKVQLATLGAELPLIAAAAEAGAEAKDSKQPLMASPLC